MGAHQLSSASSVLQRLRRWYQSTPPVLRSAATSITGESEAYLGVCTRAASDAGVFNSFRRNPAYTAVLEHVSADAGHAYHQLLSEHGRAARSLPAIAAGDTVGHPITMRLDNGVELSPTTLRYLKVADDLERMLGSLDGADVIEIGVGYGGQCRILDALFELRSYTLVDLRPVLGLAERYLAQFPLRTAVSFKTLNELACAPYDLVISNYALTELSRDLQDCYFRKVVDHSARGYITYNEIAPPEYCAYTRDEIAGRTGAAIVPEQPLTHPSNCILVWGR